MAKRASNKRKQPAAEGIPLRYRYKPRYKLDEGPLTQAQMDAIDRLQPPGRSKMTKSLF